MPVDHSAQAQQQPAQSMPSSPPPAKRGGGGMPGWLIALLAFIIVPGIAAGAVYFWQQQEAASLQEELRSAKEREQMQADSVVRQQELEDELLIAQKRIDELMTRQSEIGQELWKTRDLLAWSVEHQQAESRDDGWKKYEYALKGFSMYYPGDFFILDLSPLGDNRLLINDRVIRYNDMTEDYRSVIEFRSEDGDPGLCLGGDIVSTEEENLLVNDVTVQYEKKVFAETADCPEKTLVYYRYLDRDLVLFLRYDNAFYDSEIDFEAIARNIVDSVSFESTE